MPAPPAAVPATARRPAVRGEAERLALALLAATLGGIYAIGAATAATATPRSTGLVALQGTVALAQLAYAAVLALGVPSPALRRLGAAAQLALVALWVVSRTAGLGGPRLPVGVLDAVCAADEVLLAACALAALAPRRDRATSMLRCQLAAMLAGMTLFALGAAHHAAATHGRFFGGVPGAHYFCRPL